MSAPKQFPADPRKAQSTPTVLMLGEVASGVVAVCGVPQQLPGEGHVREPITFPHLRHSHGVYTHPNGEKYEGDWLNNVKEGKGTSPGPPRRSPPIHRR